MTERTDIICCLCYEEIKSQLTATEAKLDKTVKALESIVEYWNQNRNDKAMHDACWYSINTADEALAQIEKKN